MGQFDFLKKVGASDRAVAVLNDQPQLFTTLVVVLVGLIAECVFIWFIHFATRKPEQKKKKTKEKESKKGGDNKMSAPGRGGGEKKVSSNPAPWARIIGR